MKANEAPEKIYLQKFDTNALLCLNKYNIHEEWTERPICGNSADCNDIEYIRTDAFVEKACDAYCAICDTKECGGTGECIWVENFRKRLMK